MLGSGSSVGGEGSDFNCLSSCRSFRQGKLATTLFLDFDCVSQSPGASSAIREYQTTAIMSRKRDKSTPVFNRLLSKLDEFQRETSVIKRRTLAEELFQLFSDTDIRRKLAVEATPKSCGPDDPSVIATRCLKLSHLYHLVIQNALNYGEGLLSRSKKIILKEGDIMLPYQLVKALNKSDDGWDTEGRGIPKIRRKTVRLLLKHCLAMLDLDEAVAVAHGPLLEELSYLCSRVEFVGFFKPSSDFATIMEAIGKRLDPEDDGNTETHVIRLHASRAFCGLFQTCRTLGIDVRQFLPSSVAMVATWCKHQIAEENIQPGSPILPSYFNGLVALFNLHPEYAIGPLRRQGRHILRYAKK